MAPSLIRQLFAVCALASLASGASDAAHKLSVNVAGSAFDNNLAHEVGPVANCFDGIVDGYNFCHSFGDHPDKTWLRIDLGSKKVVNTLDITNRLDGWSDRLSDFQLWAGDDATGPSNGGNAQCHDGSYSLTAVAGIEETFVCNTYARYVYIKNLGNVIINLMEVEVFGVQPSPGAISSAKSCDDFGWVASTGWAGDTPEVCGSSDHNAVGLFCSGFQTYEEAVGHCTAVGARLCTNSEIINNEVAGTGCGYDDARVWSSTSCGDGSRLTRAGRVDVLAHPEQCDSEVADKRYTRCCADTVVFDWEIPGGAQTEINIYQARVFSPMYIGTDTIVAAENRLEAGDPAAGAAQVDVLCSADTTQTLDFYAFAGNSGDDSFFMEMLPYGTSLDWHIHNSGSWKWETGTSGYPQQAYKYPLQAGRNILRITERESLARVSKVRFEDDTCVQVDPISYSPCVAGQGEAFGVIASHAGNSLEWCRAKCDTNPACGAFDISVTTNCRLYATGNAARIGDNTDNRQYCEQTTASPTAAPTSAPTGAPTQGSIVAKLETGGLQAGLGYVFGYTGDNAYMCSSSGGSTLCVKSVAASRSSWTIVADDSAEVLAATEEATGVTMSDGAWEVTPGGPTFTFSDGSQEFYFPAQCDCA